MYQPSVYDKLHLIQTEVFPFPGEYQTEVGTRASCNESMPVFDADPAAFCSLLPTGSG